jgi:hypothetical protein
MSCIEQSLDVRDTTSTLARFVLMLRRLDDRIRALCAKAVQSKDPAEIHNILCQLRAALREHTQRLRRLAVNSPNSQRRAG